MCWMVIRRSQFAVIRAEECWRIVDPVLQAWREGKVPMDEYAAGSDGPANWD